MFQRLSILVAAVGLALAPLAHASSGPPVELAGVQIPRYLQTPGRLLELASCGVRDTLWLEHYVAALYVPRGASTRVLQDRASPKAVVMQVVNERFIPDSIPSKWRGALRASLDRSTFSRVQTAFGSLGSGDRVTVMYLPEEGLTMRVNGRVVAREKSHGVIDAILDAWKENETLTGRLERLRSEHPCT